MKISILRFQLFLMTSLVPFGVQAIAFGPIKVYSQVGQVLYAELSFSHANPQYNIKVESAPTDALDYLHLIDHNLEHYNYTVQRQANATSGLIILSSNTPIQQQQLNILMKIHHDAVSYFKQVNIQLLTNHDSPPTQVQMATESVYPSHHINASDQVLRTNNITGQIESELQQLSIGKSVGQ